MSIEEIYELFVEYPLISTDTRQIKKGSLFFALKGDTFNGNLFASEAIEKGAVAAVIDEEKYAFNSDYILVDNVLHSLQQLANFHRRQLKIPVIGITGSNGKTTTKELIKAVLSKKYNTFATHGNLNNHIGVPLSLLSVNKQHEIAVIEMGANHVGEIEQLCNICDPDYGIITNIGKAHLEGFGGIEGVIKGKTELYRHINKKNGKLFVNSDSKILISNANEISKIVYGQDEKADYIGKISNDTGCISFTWKANSENDFCLPVSTNFVGDYNLSNLLSAVAIGAYFGVEKEEINKAISEYVPDNNRSQEIKKGSNTIIMDAYNANPTSMLAALNNFSKSIYDKKAVIIGEMLEMGDYSLEEHTLLVNNIDEKKFNMVILVGKEFEKTKLPEYFYHFKSTLEAKNFIAEKPLSGYCILVKGSRGNRLETLLDVL
jgi:UDP-N-acetylmuramoyl-tripeptide--D-alanyl-D-alanine ligase